MNLIFDLETMELPEVSEFVELAKRYHFEVKMMDEKISLLVSKQEES